MGTTPSHSSLSFCMKARGSALKVTWKKGDTVFLSHRGYKIKECQKVFQESTLFGLLVVRDQIVQWLLPLAAFFCVILTVKVVKVETFPKDMLGTEKTLTVTPKASQHPGVISPWPPGQRRCEPNWIAHPPRFAGRAGVLLNWLREPCYWLRISSQNAIC